MELTQADAGGTTAVGVGDQLVVRLAENRTTGYRWQLTVPDGLVLEDDGYEPGPAGVPGAGGTRTFRLRATAPGTHRIAAAQRRSWETGAGADPALEFTVHVR